MNNLIYTCGHYGHVLLPEKYDGLTITAQRFMDENLTAVGKAAMGGIWECGDCAKSRVQAKTLRMNPGLKVGIDGRLYWADRAIIAS